MTDIASLGVEVDARDAVRGARDLDQFSSAAQRASRRSDELRRASEASNREVAAASTITQRAAAALGSREQASQSLLRAELALARAHHARAQAELQAMRATGAATEDQMEAAAAAAMYTRAELAAARATDLEAAALRNAIEAHTSAAAAASELSSRYDVLASKFTEGYAATLRMDAALDELVEAERLGVQITGGYALAIDNIILKHDAAARAAAEQRAELDRLRQAEQLAASSSDAQAHINRLVGVQTQVQKSARESMMVFDAQAREMEAVQSAAMRLRAALDPMGASQRRYNQEIAEYNRLASLGAITARELGQAHALAAARLSERNTQQGILQSANVNRMYTGNIAAQFHDIGVMAAAGQNPLQTALQQGTQLAAVFTQMERPMIGIADAFMSLLNPITLFTLAAVALVSAGLQLVDWAATAKGALDLLAMGIEAIAPYAVAAGAALAILYSPAIIAGVVQLIALLARLAVQAAITAAALAAANPALALIVGITATVAALSIFSDEIKRTFGVDLANAAKGGVNWLIGTLVGGFNGVRETWGQLPAVLGDITYSAAQKAVQGVEWMVNQVIVGINKVINFARSAGVDIDEIGSVDFGDVKNPFAGAAKGVADQMGVAINTAQNVDYVGGFTKAIADGASYAAQKLKDLSASIVGTDAESEKAAKRSARRYEKIVLDANQFIEGQRLERESMRLSELAAARLRHEQDLFNKAADAGIKLTPVQISQLKSLAIAMGDAEIATNRAQEALDFAKDLTHGFVADLRSGLEEGKSIWQAFGDAALNVLNKVVDKLLNDVINALFEVNSATGSGGGFGGFLTNLFGGLFGAGTGATSVPMPMARPAGLIANAAGGVYNSPGLSTFSNSIVTRPTTFAFARGAGLMGEAGPEAILPLQKGRGGRLGVAGAGGGMGDIQIFDQRGANAPPIESRRERGPDGRMQMKLWIREEVNETIARGHADQPMRSRFGMGPRKV